MNTIQVFDRRWSLSGTILFHIAIIVPLFFIKCNGTGGGGGNNGQGLEGLMSLDIAGFGDTEYGFGEDYVRATAAVFNEPTIQEEAPAKWFPQATPKDWFLHSSFLGLEFEIAFR